MRCGLRHAVIVGALAVAGCAAPLPEAITPPHVHIADVRLVALTVFEQRYTLSLRMQNPNAFALPVTGMSVTFSVNDKAVGQGVSDAAFALPALGEAVREVEIVSDLGRMADALQQGRGEPRGAGDYRLRGQLIIEGRRQPLVFEYRGEVRTDG